MLKKTIKRIPLAEKTYKVLRTNFVKVIIFFNMQKASKRILKCKNVHFMFNDKFANPTINFINKHFSKEEHLFLVRRINSQKYTCQPFPKGQNVIEFVFNLLNPKDFKNKKLIFHSLFDGSAVSWLYNNPDLLKNSYWMVWGGDLYNASTDEVNTFVRQNVYGIGSPCDNDLVRQKYGDNHSFFDTAMVVFPTNKNINLKQLRENRIQNSLITIQINNSADDSTIEMLDVLSKFRNENIHIKTILSYGKTIYKQDIINKGNELFGDKFSYMEKVVSPEDYAKYLSNNDILILNQNRQQGVGNTISSIILGTKVFIRSEITTTQYLEKHEIIIFDANKIKDMSFREFCDISQETIVNNIKNAEFLWSDEKLVNDFSTIFNDNKPTLNQKRVTI